MPQKQMSLYYKNASSDKEYHLQLEQAPGSALYLVNFQYGRRGSTLTPGCKTPCPLPYDKAAKVFDDVVKKQKAKGYSEGEAGTPFVGTSKEDRATDNYPQLLNPIDEDEVERLLRDPAWGAQEKMDGKHVMIEVSNGEAKASNRKGLQIGIPQSMADAAVRLCKGKDNLLDGEAIGDMFHVFDLPRAKGGYLKRFIALFWLCGKEDGRSIRLVRLAVTEHDKRDLYERLKKENKEGIVFKRLDAPYKPGRPSSGGTMLKHKFYATCSCMVVQGRSGKRSIGLALNDVKGPRDITVINVGNCTVPANQPVPKVGDIVEVRYLYAYKGGSLYQPVLLGIRDDLDEVACDTNQLKFKAEEE